MKWDDIVKSSLDVDHIPIEPYCKWDDIINQHRKLAINSVYGYKINELDKEKNIMTLNSMNQYLEDRGFNVKRSYDSITHTYSFTISKHHHFATYYWTYSDDQTKQIEFLDSIIAEFETKTAVLSEDIEKTYAAKASIKDYNSVSTKIPEIKKVIFNNPATVVMWSDGTKTVVKAQGKSRYDKEKGLAMCIAKKALGNKGNYYNTFAKWLND